MTARRDEVSRTLRAKWLDEGVFPLGPTLGSAAVHVAWAIARHLNNRTLVCFPGSAVLCKDTGLSERTIRDAVNDLCTRELLRIKRARNNVFVPLLHGKPLAAHLDPVSKQGKPTDRPAEDRIAEQDLDNEIPF